MDVCEHLDSASPLVDCSLLLLPNRRAFELQNGENQHSEVTAVEREADNTELFQDDLDDIKKIARKACSLHSSQTVLNQRHD
eukprot:SAG31_NODE_2469_length_5650_cov_2.117636_4_plen_82_part_00